MVSARAMNSPSEKALAMAVHAVLSGDAVCPEIDARIAVEAAHGPKLGLDRSVCLRDVMAAIVEWQVRLNAGTAGPLLDFIERTFGGAD